MTDTNTSRTHTSQPTVAGGRTQPPAAPDRTPTAPPGPAPARRPASPAVPRTRTGSLWVGLTSAIAVVVLLLVFILQNSQSVQINFLGMHGRLSFAVALLFAAAGGMLLVAIPGTGRIMQLRRRVHRRGGTDQRS